MKHVCFILLIINGISSWVKELGFDKFCFKVLIRYKCKAIVLNFPNKKMYFVEKYKILLKRNINRVENGMLIYTFFFSLYKHFEHF